MEKYIVYDGDNKKETFNFIYEFASKRNKDIKLVAGEEDNKFHTFSVKILKNDEIFSQDIFCTLHIGNLINEKLSIYTNKEDYLIKRKKSIEEELICIKDEIKEIEVQKEKEQLVEHLKKIVRGTRFDMDIYIRNGYVGWK